MTDERVRSRRAVLAAGLGGVAAATTAAVIRPAVALADNGDPVVLGQANTATAATAIQNTGTADPDTLVIDSQAGVAVVARSENGSGVEGQGLNGLGVYGLGQVGVVGEGTESGVRGISSGDGIGVFATTETGLALLVDGKVGLTRSGRVSIPRGKGSVDITIPGGITSRTVVMATLQRYRTGVAIAGVNLNWPTAGKARIYLTKIPSTTTTTPVAWIATELP
jgi:hypothetical protein